ncbi:hypothetical protein JCM17845_11250 [Iodidimonas gelatinilytica]|uniref:Flagellin n=1 Tax=Iodidimonas gelatinilytica TaxID=1236966 RepID=A0A5A7MX32_9PROT|nr:flagellin [Iodidimonas gelatinilytica]GER00502.1 hypothetical protein JCM17845_11250 [Iodidimonas gelatinilytica]
MAFSVNTNQGAFLALQSLSNTNSQLATTQNRISTGLEVASVRDDSATFLIAQNQRSDLAGINAARSSLDRAQSTLDVATDAAEAIDDLLIEAREIAVQVQDSGLDSASVSSLNNDFGAIVSQIDSIVGQAEFNGTNLINGSGQNLDAITGVNRAGTISRISVGGQDLTTAGATATAASVTVDGDVTINSGGGATDIVDETSAGTAVASFDANVRNNTDFLQAIVDNGLDTDGVIAVDANGNATGLDFANSGATFTDGGAGVNDTVAFSFGTTTFTLTTNDTTVAPSGGLADADTAGNITNVAVTGTAQVVADVTNGVTLTDVTLNSIDFNTADSRNAAVQVVDNFRSQLSTVLSTLGSSSQQISLQSEFASNLSDSIEVGIGNLVDADLSREAASLQALQVQQQLGLQAAGIANQAPGSILALFR